VRVKEKGYPKLRLFNTLFIRAVVALQLIVSVGESIVRPSPFDKSGRFYRGNLHSHSTHSDGEKSAEEVCRTYRELGYDFLAIL